MELLSLLFMSSCFLTLSRLTFGDQSGTTVNANEGDDAILPCSLGTNIEFVRFEWKKEGTEEKVFISDTGVNNSPALPGRVSYFRDDLKHGNASIRINKVHLKDGGNYTCDFPNRGKTFRIELVVVKNVTKVTVKEDDDAILPCFLGTNVNITSKLFDWQKEGKVKVLVYNPDSNPPLDKGDMFKDRVSHFPGELRHGNASIKIIKTRLEDKGTYSCFFPHNRKTFYIKLDVGELKDRTAENKDAVSKPIVRLLDDKGLLECEVRGISNETTVEWWDNDNNILTSQKEIKDPYIIVKTTATKTGNYSCVATQEDLNHRILTTTFVPLNIPESNTGWIVAGVLAGVLAVVLAVVLVVVGILVWCYFKNKKKMNKKESSEPSAQELKPNADQSV